MTTFLTVEFGDDVAYDFRIGASDTGGLSQEAARQWVDSEYIKAGFQPASGMEVPEIVADKVLKVARAAGKAPFEAHADWAHQFARHVSVLIGRPNITVDVENSIVGY
jgi:hypothetical protein